MSSTERRSSHLKIGALLSYAAIGMQFVVTIAYTPIMLRLLGQAEFGLYSLVQSIVAYLSLLSFGLGGAYVRFYERFRVLGDAEGVARLNGLFFGVFSAIGLIACCAGVLLAMNASTLLGGQFSAGEIETAKMLFWILAVNVAMTFAVTVFNSHIIAQERFIFQKLVQIARTVCTPIAVLPVLVFGYGSVGMALAVTGINVAASIYSVQYCFRKLRMRFAFKGLEFKLFREVSVFSGYLFIYMVVDQINWNVDKFIVGRYHGAAPVAVYGVAALLVANYLTFSTAISSVFVPRVNQMVAEGGANDMLSDLFIRVGRIQFLVLGLVCTGFILFGSPFIQLWAGTGYEDAYLIALLMLVPVTFPLVQNLGIEIQKAKNLHQFRSWVYLGVAAGNIALSIPLTQRFGGIGAAAATGAALIVGNLIIMNWHYHARVGLNMWLFWRKILRLALGMVPALVFGIGLVFLVDLEQVLNLVLAVSLYTVIFGSSMWWLGMNDGERSLVRSPVRRMLYRVRRGNGSRRR